MKRNTIFFALSLAIGILIFTSCSNPPVETAEAVETVVTTSEMIEITKAQFLKEKMAFGSPVYTAFEESFQSTGKIVSDINGTAQISSAIDGLIKKVYVQEGQFVKAGTVLLEIGGSPLIDLQQAYAISSSKIKQLQMDFERIQTLFQDHIKTENEFMVAQSAYQSELANLNALKIKLKNIGLNITKIENGEYASTFPLKAPITGQVVNLNVTLGAYISAQKNITEIINSEKNQLQLSVFEREYSKIKLGQKVFFGTAGEQDFSSSATISRISKILNPKSKSFDCFAEIAPEDKGSFIINQLVRSEIIIKADSVYAVPETAITTSGNSTYVYVLDHNDEASYFIDKMKVQLGRTSKGFVELIDFQSDSKVLLSGAYNLRIE